MVPNHRYILFFVSYFCLHYIECSTYNNSNGCCCGLAGPTGFTGPGVRQNVPMIGVLISDGYSNVIQNNTVPEANLAKSAGIVMYSIVVNTNNNLPEMQAVISPVQTKCEYFYFAMPRRTHESFL